MNHNVPRLIRRDFLRLSGIGIAGYSLMPTIAPRRVFAKERIEPRDGAEICILLFLAGGPSQVDTFDIKEGPWTPEDFDIRTINSDLRMPVGTLPRLSERLQKFAIARSMGAWDLNHDRSIYHLLTGRAFCPGRSKEVPSAGAVMAYEYLNRRTEADYLPPFISFDVQANYLVGCGCGLLPANCAPMNVYPTRKLPFSLPNTARDEFHRRRDLLEVLDREWRAVKSGRSSLFDDFDKYRNSAVQLSDPKVQSLFALKPEDEQRYGQVKNEFGHLGYACAMARNIVAADAGTRFILIQHTTWDLHLGAYDKSRPGNQYELNAELDLALANLIDDLETMRDDRGRRLIDKTFLVVMGEFGRSGGALDKQKGRNHNINTGVALFAGSGVKGGRVLGATNESGDENVDPGWHKKRLIYPEDVLATMYSVMGIDSSKKILDTPSGRAFEYIESLSPKGPMNFGEVSELFES